MKLSPYVFQLHFTRRLLRLWKRYSSSGNSATSSGNLPSHSCSGAMSGLRQTNTMPRHDCDLDAGEVHVLRAPAHRSRGR